MAGEVLPGANVASPTGLPPATSNGGGYEFFDGEAGCDIRLSDADIDDLDEETLQQWFTDCSDLQFKKRFLLL